MAGLLLAAPLAGCNDKLDIEPVNDIPGENALLTSADVQAALVGAYDATSSNRVYGGYVQFISELLADDGDFEFVGTFVQPRETQFKAVLTNNSFVSATWNDSYRAINIANNVLANLDKVSEVERKRVEGEARFLRASLYFELVRLYGRAWNDGNPQTNPGVPLVLTPTVAFSAADKVARNTVAEVYAQVITDLSTAEANIAASNGFFATKAAAAGMLARVYLQQGRFAEAASAANRVIASNRYSLAPSYAEAFEPTANTSEDVFAIQITQQDGLNDLNTYFSPTQRGDIEVSDQHFERYEAGDERADFFDDVYTLKFDQQYGNIRILRLAEMYLIRAEGNLRTGGTVGATPLADINTVRERAGLPDLTSVTLADILKERRLELSFEGARLHDLKRNQEQATTPDSPPVIIPWNSPRLVLPIPQRERDVNPNLVQNPGYN